MPNVNPNAKGIAPGVTTTPNTYPQWGVGGGTPGSSAGWNVVEAKNAAQKQAYLDKGYVVWFSSQPSAQSYISSEQNPYTSGTGGIANPLGFLGNIANAFGDLTQANTWLRAAKIIVGGVLLVVGVARLTGTTDEVKKVAGAAASVPLPGLGLAAKGVEKAAGVARKTGSAAAHKTRAGSLKDVGRAAKGK